MTNPKPAVSESFNSDPVVAHLIKRFESHYNLEAWKGLPQFGEAMYYDPAFVQLCLGKLVRLMKKDREHKAGWDRLSTVVEETRGYPMMNEYKVA